MMGQSVETFRQEIDILEVRATRIKSVVPDIHGPGCSIFEMKSGDWLAVLPGNRDDLGEFLNVKVKWPEESVSRYMELENQEKLTYCWETLKLPASLAVFVAGSKKYSMEDLRNWPVPAVKDIPNPIMVSNCGLSGERVGKEGVGKSVYAVLLSKMFDMPILNFDPKYRDVVKGYSAMIKDCVDLDAAIGILIGGDANFKNPEVDIMTFEEVMDEVLSVFKSSAERSPVYFCDMPGIPRKYSRMHNTKDGIDMENGHFFSLYSCEINLFSTRFTPHLEAKKLDFFAEIVRDAMKKRGISVPDLS